MLSFPSSAPASPGQVAVVMARRGLEAYFGSWGSRSCAGGHTWLLTPWGARPSVLQVLSSLSPTQLKKKILSASRCCGVELDTSTPWHPEVWDHNAQNKTSGDPLKLVAVCSVLSLSLHPSSSKRCWGYAELQQLRVVMDSPCLWRWDE